MFTPTFSSAAVIEPARIRMVDGEVLFHTPDSTEWLPAAVNTPLDEGDTIWCPAGSKTEIQLAGGTLVRLDGGSQLDLLANEEGFAHLHLASGKLYARTAQNVAEKSLQIDADDTTVLPAARTRLRIDMLPNSQEDVAIFKGSAYVEGNGARTNVRAGEHIALEEGHSELLTLNPPDDWERWNSERDRSQTYSTKNESWLPEELRGHSGELAANGRWERTGEYGMVWRPTVILSDDWAPYTDGRWVWKGKDYVWVSYETWGWTPYHYGRWAVIGRLGWCWVPPAPGDIFWGPGYVGWYRTGSHIGWTPLAPGEVFYGYGNYGRHSLNLTTSQIKPGITVVYRNRAARGGLVLLPHDDFLRGNVVVARPSNTVRQTPTVSISIGSPRIQPVRESHMPVVRRSSVASTPPRVVRRDASELRQRFPRVNPDSSPQRNNRHQTPAAIVTSPPTTTQPPASNSASPGVTPTTTPLRDTVRQQPSPVSNQRQPSGIQQQSPALQPPQSQSPRSDTVRRTATGQTQETNTQQRDQERRRTVPAGANVKKVWRVVTPENGREKEIKGTEGRERRER
ncbi:MAG TPA: hypothetical protein HPP76_00145 [Desulfuromonadales bacterium]|nr:hypothetical protein [Desulfuromonadales bacterium]